MNEVMFFWKRHGGGIPSPFFKTPEEAGKWRAENPESDLYLHRYEPRPQGGFRSIHADPEEFWKAIPYFAHTVED